jgi:hypothetical protein
MRRGIKTAPLDKTRPLLAGGPARGKGEGRGYVCMREP